jgi:hypothetical protein
MPATVAGRIASSEGSTTAVEPATDAGAFAVAATEPESDAAAMADGVAVEAMIDARAEGDAERATPVVGTDDGAGANVGGADAPPPEVDRPVEAAYKPYATTTQITITAAIAIACLGFRDGP